MACRRLAGKGGTIGLLITKCLLVMGIFVSRPDNASERSGKVSFFDEIIMAYGMLVEEFRL